MDYYKEVYERSKDEFKVGDIYLDVFDHPTLCIGIDIDEKDIALWGISLFDGSYPRCCSVVHSAPEKISCEQAWEMKMQYEKGKSPHCKF